MSRTCLPDICADRACMENAKRVHNFLRQEPIRLFQTVHLQTSRDVHDNLIALSGNALQAFANKTSRSPSPDDVPTILRHVLGITLVPTCRHRLSSCQLGFSEIAMFIIVKGHIAGTREEMEVLLPKGEKQRNVRPNLATALI